MDLNVVIKKTGVWTHKALDSTSEAMSSDPLLALVFHICAMG